MVTSIDQAKKFARHLFLICIKKKKKCFFLTVTEKVLVSKSVSGIPLNLNPYFIEPFLFIIVAVGPDPIFTLENAVDFNPASCGQTSVNEIRIEPMSNTVEPEKDLFLSLNSSGEDLSN